MHKQIPPIGANKSLTMLTIQIWGHESAVNGNRKNWNPGKTIYLPLSICELYGNHKYKFKKWKENLAKENKWKQQQCHPLSTFIIYFCGSVENRTHPENWRSWKIGKALETCDAAWKNHANGKKAWSRGNSIFISIPNILCIRCKGYDGK